MPRIPAYFDCKCGTKFTAPESINEDYTKHLKMNPQLKIAVLEQSHTAMEDCIEIKVKCPKCGKIVYSWKT